MHGTLEASFRVEWRPLAELAQFADAWRALAERALDPNVFYEPAFALAAAPVFGRDVAAAAPREGGVSRWDDRVGQAFLNLVDTMCDVGPIGHVACEVATGGPEQEEPPGIEDAEAERAAAHRSDLTRTDQRLVDG